MLFKKEGRQLSTNTRVSVHGEDDDALKRCYLKGLQIQYY